MKGNKMPAAKFTDNQRERVRADVARLRLQRLTQQAIADKLTTQYREEGLLTADDSISRELVRHYWQQLTHEWRRQQREAVEQHQTAMLADVEHAAAEAWAAWEQSQADSTTTEQVLDPTTRQVKHVKVTTRPGGAGDPRYLNLVLAAVERRAKIIGADAPQRAEVSGPGGQPVQVVAFDYQAAIAPVLSEETGEE